MILTEADTLLSLEEFRQIVRMHPYHFWQLADEELVPVTSSCGDLIYEDDWMDAEAMSRQSVIEAIARAEAKLAEHLHYDVAPRYRASLLDYPSLGDESLGRGYPIDSQGRTTSLRLPYSKTLAIGARQSILIATAAVILRDANSDTLPESFQLLVTLPDGVTDPAQIAVYFSEGDRWDPMAPMSRYRVRPVSVVIADGQATITGRVWTIVRPELYGIVTGIQQAIDPTDEAVYADRLDVHYEYLDPNGTTVDDCQATLIWEVNPYPVWACAGSATSPYTPNASDPAALGKAVARAGIRHAGTGLVTPVEAVRDVTSGEWRQVTWSTGYQPDRVEVRYLAGLSTVDQAMRRYWQQTTVYLALAELEGPICACESVSQRLHHWQFDLARTGGAEDESYGATPSGDLDNPFGTRRGHVEAWKRVSSHRTTIGIAV